MKISELLENTQLKELFDQSTAYQIQWDETFSPKELYGVAHDDSGNQIDILFVPVSKKLDVIDMSFIRGGTHDVSGKGSASKVFGTVLQALNVYLGNYYRPTFITFSAKEPNRKRLYGAMVNRLSATVGYQQVDPSTLDDAIKAFFVRYYAGSEHGLVFQRSDTIKEGWKTNLGAAALGTAMAFGGAKYMQTPNNTPQAKDTPSSIVAKDATDKSAKPEEAPKEIDKKEVPKPDLKPEKVTPSGMEELLRAQATAVGITDGEEISQLIAQCAHETMGFKRMGEMGSDAYFKRRYDKTMNADMAKLLGNTEVGDGVRYKGRGFIQLTGRYNYRKAGVALGLPLEEHPEMVDDPKVAAKVTLWFWTTKVQPRISKFSNVKAVTKIINPGLKGLSDRIELYAAISKAEKNKIKQDDLPLNAF